MSLALEQLLQELDNSSQKMSEHLIVDRIKLVIKDDDSLEAKAELMAFMFCEGKHGNNEWETYFSPMISGVYENGEPLLASSWYQHLYSIYISFNLKAEADEVAKKISAIGPNLIQDMKSCTHKVDVSDDEINIFLDNISKGGSTTALNRLAFYFVPKKDQVENQVRELADNYPLSYLFNKTLQDHDGRPVAIIGNIEEDLEGNTIHQLSQNMSVESFFLRRSFLKIIDNYSITSEVLSDFIFESPLFQDMKRRIIDCGISAFLEGDFITANHLLIPQIESAIRKLVELSGGVILQKNNVGGMNLRILDNLLRDSAITECFGEDAIFILECYFLNKGDGT